MVQNVNDDKFDVQLQHSQEHLIAELAQKEKTLEEKEQLITQLQMNIQDLLIEKDKQQYHILSSQTTTNNNHNDFLIGNNTPKYDNFIEQQLLKDKINNIRKFSGNKADDIDEWLQNIEHDFSSTLVSDEIKLKIIPKSLTNDAQNWFEQNKHRLLSWTTFKIEIQRRFQSSLHKEEKFLRLRERKQQPKETGQQFIDTIEKLCFQVNPSMIEHEKMLHIKAGLKPSLKEKVLDKQPNSMEELRYIVKRIEDIDTMLNDGNSNEYQTEQSPFSTNCIQSTEDEGNCYAMPSYYNDFHRRRTRRNGYYQPHREQEISRRPYRSNHGYVSRNNSHQQWNQYQPNNTTRTNSYAPSTSNNNSKKY